MLVLIPIFINRKHGREAITYEHELLQPILKETYAVLVYQEQIMKMAQDFGGLFPWGGGFVASGDG